MRMFELACGELREKLVILTAISDALSFPRFARFIGALNGQETL